MCQAIFRKRRGSSISLFLYHLSCFFSKRDGKTNTQTNILQSQFKKVMHISWELVSRRNSLRIVLSWSFGNSKNTWGLNEETHSNRKKRYQIRNLKGYDIVYIVMKLWCTSQRGKILVICKQKVMKYEWKIAIYLKNHVRI